MAQMEIPNARTEATDAELDEALVRAIRQLIADVTESDAAL
jgi:hypothetical protein